MSKISSIIAIIVIVSSSLLLSVYLRFELPNTTQNTSIPTLGNQVTVYQDQYGIYHIDAKNQKSGLMAEGYLMARERLWQMDFYRREAEGNLSQIFYQYDHSVLQLDISLRALGLYRIAARDWKTFSSNTTTFYQEFTDGVNLFIKNNENKLPIEFGVLGYKPALWSPIDSVAILKLMAFGLNANGGGEVLIGQALSSMNASKLLDLVRLTLNNNNLTWSDPVAYPVAPKESPSTNANSSASNTTSTTPTLNPRNPRTLPPKPSQNSLYNFIVNQFSFNTELGSNNWVVSGNKTITKEPMLANDPHLALETPSKWWCVDLNIQGDFHATGMTLPGIPGIILGRNDYIMWGFTNTEIDYLDTYVETFNSNYTQYYYNGTWLNTTIIPEKFYTSQTHYITENVYITKGNTSVTSEAFAHGDRPVVPMFGANTTVRWTGQDSSSAAEGLVQMIKSKNREEFINAMHLMNAPGQNVVYADNLGNIGLIVTGDIPIRNAGYGLAPHNGSITTYNWKSMAPRSAAFQIVNPPSGFIATANNHFIPASYPYFLGYAFDSGFRAQRINDLLNINRPITYGYMEFIQNDVHSLFAQAVVPKILMPTSDPYIQSLENELRNWDYNFDVNSVQAPIFALFTQYFLNFTLGDKVPAGFIDKIPIQGKLIENLLNLPQNSFWFNNTQTNQTETKNVVILEAFNAVKNYYLSHNLNINSFTWGQLHKVQFSHVIGSQVPLLSFLNAGGLQPSPGSQNTINVGTYNSKFIQMEGPSMRQIMGMDLNKTYFAIIPPGQSGIVGSGHYADQISRWLEGNYCSVIIEK